MTNVSFSQIDKSASGLYSLAVVNSTGELWHYFKITIEGEQLLGATLLEIMRYVDIMAPTLKKRLQNVILSRVHRPFYPVLRRCAQPQRVKRLRLR